MSANPYAEIRSKLDTLAEQHDEALATMAAICDGELNAAKAEQLLQQIVQYQASVGMYVTTAISLCAAALMTEAQGGNKKKKR